ncbi:MAG: hypothetical protein ABJC62_04255 [Frankiaceae bacterium]
MQGHYPAQAGRFADASRAEEDRQIGELRDFASRADALDADNLDDVQQETRAVLAGTARDTADLLEARLKEIAHGRRCPPIRFCTGSRGHAWVPQASVVHKDGERERTEVPGCPVAEPLQHTLGFARGRLSDDHSRPVGHPMTGRVPVEDRQPATA